jgi:hypothetical protein
VPHGPSEEKELKTFYITLTKLSVFSLFLSLFLRSHCLAGARKKKPKKWCNKSFQKRQKSPTWLLTQASARS